MPTVSYLSSLINYTISGNGKKILVCLHGYDENADTFDIFCKPLVNDYTSICIDMPFHGKTSWKESAATGMGGHDWEEIIDRILKQETRFVTQFTLVGYSMGGRIALSLFEYMPQKIEKLILLAPDGFTNNFWYWLATQTYLGNRLFRFSVHHPAWVLQLAKMLYTFRIINFGVLKLARHYLEDKELAEQLYARWTCFRKSRPDFNKIIQSATENQTPVRLVFGKFDHLILQRHATTFCQSMGSLCKLTVINSGHHLLREQYLEALTAQVYN
jgi:pimeloyl-ACP methyl ester carboxylesterase